MRASRSPRSSRARAGRAGAAAWRKGVRCVAAQKTDHSSGMTANARFRPARLAIRTMTREQSVV
eukprot:6177022-Pleurochrysis_carterae.AAC.4